MASEAQIAANRRNAEKSTGPATPEGKRVAAVNSVRHGIYSSFESFTEREVTDFMGIFNQHLEAWEDPTDEPARRIIREIAFADYRRERIRATLFRMMAHEQMNTAEMVEEEFGEDADLGTRDAVIFKSDMLGPNLFTRLIKLENSCSRHMARSTEELKARLELLRKRHLPAPQTSPAPQTATEPPAAGLQPSSARKSKKNETNPIVPRGAACPCGSGRKYKRCCGKHAPPLLQTGPQTM